MAVLVLLVGIAITTYALMEMAGRPVAGFIQTLQAAVTRSKEEGQPVQAAVYRPDDVRLEELLALVRTQQEQLEKQMALMEDLKANVETLARDGGPQAEEKDKRTAAADRKSQEVVMLHRDIYRLHDQGVPLVDIARQVGRGKGEVKLILGLRK